MLSWMGLRLIATRRTIRELIDASRQGRPVLLNRGPGFIRGHLLDELVRSNNALVQENAAISDTGNRQFEQIRTTLANLREAVVMIDADKQIQLANPAFTELAGGDGDPIGKRLDLFISGPRFHEFLAGIKTTEEGRRMEFEALVNGKIRWLEISMAPLPKDLYPENRYTLFVFHDITRQKNLEKMRTEFVANVSHELRTPVTVIKGFAETLREDDDILSPEQKTRFLEKIHSHSERLDSLLRDLLLLARLESTELALEKELLPVSKFLSDLTDTWESILGESNGKLVQQYGEGDDTILADPLRLTQVVTNLLQNTVHHARGFTVVYLKTKLEQGGVRLIVEDDGAGIPEKDLPHIFQRFYRVEKGRSRESGGTGLGLAIVKHIVGQHKGKIEAHSVKGGGTRIEIFFPRPQTGSTAS
jgi:two-component system phosphate regulon sensor histidine kinase PhoR